MTRRVEVNTKRSANVAGVTIRRHATLATVAALLAFGFWRSRMEWSPDMRLWRAVGDAAIMLLFTTLAMGPAAKLWSSAGWLLRWRRETGVWAAVAALVHALLVIDGWTQWSLRRLLGYEFVPQLAREARMEPGFGLANLIGLVALMWLLILLASSSDRAMRFLGPPAWKWLHNGAYVVFYLALIHAAYYLFIHYTVSFHKPPVPSNWFRVPLLALGFAVLALQWAAFARSVRRRRRHPRDVASAAR